MTFIKYYTSATFNNAEFAQMLNKCGVQSRPVKDGVILNREQFNAIKPAHLPHWAFVNRKDINSDLHTREAFKEEVLTTIFRFALCCYTATKYEIMSGANTVDSLIPLLPQYANGALYVIMDTSTGEIMLEHS